MLTWIACITFVKHGTAFWSNQIRQQSGALFGEEKAERSCSLDRLIAEALSMVELLGHIFSQHCLFLKLALLSTSPSTTTLNTEDNIYSRCR